MTKVTENFKSFRLLTRRSAYDEKGNILSEVAPNGSIVTYTYDEKGNVLTLKRSTGSKFVWSYEWLTDNKFQIHKNGKVILTAFFPELYLK